jgi:hypothetical protein
VPADVDDGLLRFLTNALSAALADAIEAGVESDVGFSLSDADVPSVAKHEQNAYRAGFLPIVRVIAETWTRLANTAPQRALAYVGTWEASPYRLIRRLALFAAADATVPAHRAAQILVALPARELFLTNSSVEVHRLIDARWRELGSEERQAIERRIAEGPPRESFREDPEQMVDRCRFDLLGYIAQNMGRLSADAQAMLDRLRRRWPTWRLRPKDRAGFHVWSGLADFVASDTEVLRGVSDALLVATADTAVDEAGFRDSGVWPALCRTDASRALRGLEEEVAVGRWPAWAWNSLLCETTKQQDRQFVARVAQLLLQYPKERFSEVAADASWWLNEVTKTLDEELLWPLWDRIAEASLKTKSTQTTSDTLTAALNHPAGRLAEVLLKKLTKSSSGGELAEPQRLRLDKLTTAQGDFGNLARARLAAEVSFLFEQAPRWTKERIVPLFDWSSSEAGAAWSARQYASYIGSPALFGLTKRHFLELFGRAEVSEEELQTFAQWLAAIVIANQRGSVRYPITPTEARSALRRAGERSLPSVGHRLAIEMEGAKPDEKVAVWREVIGPVFRSIWPLDVELQTSASTFKLVQLLRASGAAFREAAELVIPFIRPDTLHGVSVYSISEAEDILYSSSPEMMLDLTAAVVGDSPLRRTHELRRTLERIRERAPYLANTGKFQKLLASSGAG